MAGVFVPFAWNVIYISNLIPIYRIDLTPAAFTITGIILAWGLFKLRLFDIVPIAYDIIIEGMSDGIIVVDVRDRIVDINHTGEQIIDRSLSSAFGQPLATVLSDRPELEKPITGFTGGRTETTIKTIETDGSEKYYRVTISLLFDKHEHLRGRLIQIHDMTQDQRDKLMKNELEERAHQLSRLTSRIASRRTWKSLLKEPKPRREFWTGYSFLPVRGR